MTNILKSLIVCGALISLAPVGHAWAPDAKEQAAALNSGDFSAYGGKLTEWLNEKTPASANEAALKALIKDPVFLNALDQRQLIVKVGADKLAAFAKASPANKEFIAWLLGNTEALELFLEGAVPPGNSQREANNYGINVNALEIWNKIRLADPDAKQGFYQKLAIATGLRPPGTGAPGAGQTGRGQDPVVRYQYFKNAHKNKELFPSFDNINVWEMGCVVNTGASEEDLTWARNMINTWRPDLRINEQVINSTREVWRRKSPHPFTNYKTVLSGGGKCGPRSSWSVMICQAFGIPAVGVGQPAHACAAYRAVNAMVEPQPGSHWKVAYGRGWQVSRLEGTGGEDFHAGMQERDRAVEFSQVERLRWLASAISAKERATAIMDVARAIQKASVTVKTDVTASLKPEEAEAEVKPKAAAEAKSLATGPIKIGAGATRFDAAAFANLSKGRMIDCFTGGKQINFDKSIDESFVEYALDVPAAGTYVLELTTAAANLDQALDVSVGANKIATLKVPYSTGLWAQTPATEVALEKGAQTLKISAPNQRGVAIRWVELKSK